MFNGQVNYKWPFSIAIMLVYQRVYHIIVVSRHDARFVSSFFTHYFIHHIHFSSSHFHHQKNPFINHFITTSFHVSFIFPSIFIFHFPISCFHHIPIHLHFHLHHHLFHHIFIHHLYLIHCFIATNLASCRFCPSPLVFWVFLPEDAGRMSVFSYLFFLWVGMMLGSLLWTYGWKMKMEWIFLMEPW